MKCVCVVCGKEYEPKPEIGAIGRIYCSSGCAWDSSTSRSPESMQREVDALRKMLNEKPS